MLLIDEGTAVGKCVQDYSRVWAVHWRPAWDIEGRSPPWTSAAAASALHNPFGGDKFFWGNMLAIDILQLKENEGAEYDADISLLFAGMYSLFFIFLTPCNHHSLTCFVERS